MAQGTQRRSEHFQGVLRQGTRASACKCAAIQLPEKLSFTRNKRSPEELKVCALNFTLLLLEAALLVYTQFWQL